MRNAHVVKSYHPCTYYLERLVYTVGLYRMSRSSVTNFIDDWSKFDLDSRVTNLLVLVTSFNQSVFDCTCVCLPTYLPTYRLPIYTYLYLGVSLTIYKYVSMCTYESSKIRMVSALRRRGTRLSRSKWCCKAQRIALCVRPLRDCRSQHRTILVIDMYLSIRTSLTNVL